MHQLLLGARVTVLRDALMPVLGQVDPDLVAAEMKRHSPRSARKVLAASGIRDEFVFATPCVLEAGPSLLGYYRLLLGVSQKAFYTSETGLHRYKRMETHDLLKHEWIAELPDLCSALNEQLAELVNQLSPQVTQQDVDQLPLLTLGSQLDGSLRVDIGKKATEEVFVAIREVVEKSIISETTKSLTVLNSSGRTVRIVLAADPDVAFYEDIGGKEELQVALEIKGGTDRSNAHNRAGEAEKSHQKVKTTARDFWTIIALKGVNPQQLALESPTTRRWYDVAEVLGRTGPHWTKFENDVRVAVGI